MRMKITASDFAMLLLLCTGMFFPVQGAKLETLSEETMSLYRQGH